MSGKGRRWIATINNYDDDIEQHLADISDNGEEIRYAIIAREIGEQGTKHLQCFFIFRKPKRLRAVRELLSPRGHYELVRGTSEQARDYCKKDGDFDEHGDFAGKQGERNDLGECFTWAKEFETEHGRPPNEAEIAGLYPELLVKFRRLPDIILLRSEPIRFEPVEFNDWQKSLKERLETDPDDRTIDFIVDTAGGKGKTTFCRQMYSASPEKVQIFSTGKSSDAAYSVDENKSIFLFNIPRGKMEFISYDLLEQLKDRMVWSGKYESKMKMLRNNTHVVVLCNEYPDMDKLTEDRYNIITL